MAADRRNSADELSFEDLLACPYLQFDMQSELLTHLVAFGPAETAPAVTISPVATAPRQPWLFNPVANTTVAYS